jgi:hypothetical protein
MNLELVRTQLVNELINISISQPTCRRKDKNGVIFRIT